MSLPLKTPIYLTGDDNILLIMTQLILNGFDCVIIEYIRE